MLVKLNLNEWYRNKTSYGCINKWAATELKAFTVRRQQRRIGEELRAGGQAGRQGGLGLLGPTFAANLLQ